MKDLVIGIICFVRKKRMRNRTKCKLCDAIIETFHHENYHCKCLENSENIEGTWAKALKDNWLAFNEVVRIMDDSNGKVPHEKWREDILWDMQKRHYREINEKQS